MNNLKKLTLFVGILFLTACSGDKEIADDGSVKSITINYAITPITDGLSRQLSVTVLPTSAANKAVTWTVSDPTIAAISQTGLLTPLKNGTVTVDATAKDGSGISKQVTITITGVTGPVVLATSVTIGGTNSTDGQSQQLSLALLPADATNKTVTWSTSSAIATISATGILTPKLNGTVIIYATANDGSGKVGQLQLTISGVTTAYATKVRSESILIWQRSNGGWGKAVPDLSSYNIAQTDAEKATALSTKNSTDTTIDNGHVTTELRWLLEDYKSTNNPNYLVAAEKAIDFLFTAQYANGGWPQYYPDKSGYRHQITYNDDAIVKVMNVMWDISKSKNNLDLVNPSYKSKAVTAFNKGIEIILKTQITSPAGKKTAWCAQHDEVTLLPALARAYELPSISGSESVGITRTLMLVEQPSAEVKQAIKDAVDWFNSAKIYDIKTQATTNPTDVVVVASPGNILWARFYDLTTGLPFFCGRDGIKKNTLAEIEVERRTGYSWYGNWPSGLIGSEYTAWKTKHGL
ncbi:pectate lyase, PelA/Pel-15E family [Flavobacterium fluvii]|uniref:Pectate lyase, PelA/Pel-15E family n=1 Tax=Flavobacterium fluvii TaxID=468056 RepID=A0A1M5EB09_9FLAO|nr:pectate lyase [Flavobacterium fluvii]SHF76419.1 pectate lyase, PelA/Pel-15E family [Flavobacterium fluvii]